MSELLQTRWKRRKKVNSFLNGGRHTHKYQTGKIMCQLNVKGMSVTSSSSEQNNYRIITEDQFFFSKYQKYMRGHTYCLYKNAVLSFRVYTFE